MNHADANAVKITEYPFTEKPWGSEKLVVATDKYAFKIICMNKGVRSSLQAHEFKLETIYVMSGSVELELAEGEGGSTFCIYNPGESYTVHPGVRHRVHVLEDAVLHEVSTPELDDVIRFEDDFGR